MIGLLEGKVSFSNEKESVLLTNTGVGYQVYTKAKLPLGEVLTLFVSSITKETGTELFGFNTYQEKKFFELLISVKGVGPKSAFALMSHLTIELTCSAIISEEKNVLKEAPGIGNKVASQIILDLKEKVQPFLTGYSHARENDVGSDKHVVMAEAILACKQLGLAENKVVILANQIMRKNSSLQTSELVQQILREIRS